MVDINPDTPQTIAQKELRKSTSDIIKELRDENVALCGKVERLRAENKKLCEKINCIEKELNRG